MFFMGISGGLNLVHENPLLLPGAFLHDGAAVLVEDGRVVAAVEEERLNRIKHSNKFPAAAIRYCLDEAGLRLRDVDRIGFYATEGYCNALLGRLFAAQRSADTPLDAMVLFCALLEHEFGEPVDPEKIRFVGHHDAHAVSAFAMSGFEEALILAIDGYGDFLSGIVARGRETGIDTVKTFTQANSLGLFYLEAIRFLGYGPFDEYKVMGLAPYGDASVYRDLFDTFYQLDPDGDYTLFTDRIAPALLANIEVRAKSQPFTQQHKNVAAALQAALERIVLHVLTHHLATTSSRRLCLAGGVAHNCTMNGKLLYSGLVEDIFVQPAAHDAGCALGAALILSRDAGRPARRKRLREVYWGPELADDEKLAEQLADWGGFVGFERHDDISNCAAAIMAEGGVIGWVQGRSEFGPRALGNRSILADPRPAENKDRINAMVKKREGYRPFAPSVLEEDAGHFFVMPEGTDSLPFMIFVMQVKEDKRALLGAITHVDGTARVHTVARQDNPAYWALIDAFKRRTGVPILLNTSFNNHAEPIVDSAVDAVRTFLTTRLDALVIGNYLVTKRAVEVADWKRLRLSLPPYAQLHQTRGATANGGVRTLCDIRTTFSASAQTVITPELFKALMAFDNACLVGDLLAVAPETANQAALLAEIEELWTQRLIDLRPEVDRHRRSNRMQTAAEPPVQAAS